MTDFVSIVSTKKLKPQVLRQGLLNRLAIIDYNFIAIRYRSFPEAILEETLIFTSVNAVHAFIKNSNGDKSYKAYCINGETASAVEKVTNITIQGVAADAVTLAQKIVHDNHVKKLSFIASQRRRPELLSILAKNKVKVYEVTGYETIYNGTPVKHPYDGIFFFSPSGAESFFQANLLTEGVTCFCIGRTTAAAVKEYTSNEVVSAQIASQEQLVDTAIQFYHKKTKRYGKPETSTDGRKTGTEE